MTDPSIEVFAPGGISYLVDKMKDWTGDNFADNSVAVPSTSGSGGSNGLLSAADKEKLDGVAAGATANVGTITGITTSSPLSGSGTSGSVALSHATSGPSSSADTSRGDTSAQTPSFGGTFKALSATVDKYGHTTALAEHTVTIPSATATASTGGEGGSAGLMSASDKEKLNGVAAGATANVGTITGITTNSPLSGSGSSGSVALSHANSGVAADSYGDSTAQTPGFGGTFKALRGTVNATGHLTQLSEHNVTIPNTTASASTAGVGGSAGLMSASDKEKLNGIATGATANVGTVTGVTAGAGLSGGTISSSGTIKADLQSETRLSHNATAATSPAANRVYPVAMDASGDLAVAVPWEDTQAVSGVKGNAETDYRTGDVNITAANIGLGNVDNTSDVNKPVSTAVQNALDGKVSTSMLGVANGVAQLGADGTVPESQLPSYVDDVMEYDEYADLPATGESGKIYVTVDDNRTYRWSGSMYVEIFGGLTLGTTHSTAFYGDQGAAAYAHGVTNKGTQLASGLWKFTTNAEGHVTAGTAAQASDITALGIPAQDTTYTAGTGLVLDAATSTVFSLDTVGPGAGTSGSTTGQTPAFGGTADVPYVTTDVYGRVSGRGTATVTIPNSTATQSAAGLMSAADKTKLDGVSSVDGGSYYATSSTGAAAAAKGATCVGLELRAGTRLRVKFTNANTASGALTLAVNGGTAYPIHVCGLAVSASNELWWGAGASIDFLFDGSAFNVDQSPCSYYGACSTAADTVAKNVGVMPSGSAAVVFAGCIVAVEFTYAHNSTTGATLYVTGQSGTAAAVYNSGSAVNNTNANSWAAASTAAFIFDGQYWRMLNGKASWGQLAG